MYAVHIIDVPEGKPRAAYGVYLCNLLRDSRVKPGDAIRLVYKGIKKTRCRLFTLHLSPAECPTSEAPLGKVEPSTPL